LIERGPSAFMAFIRASLPLPSSFRKLFSLESLASDLTVSLAVAVSIKKKESQVEFINKSRGISSILINETIVSIFHLTKLVFKTVILAGP